MNNKQLDKKELNDIDLNQVNGGATKEELNQEVAQRKERDASSLTKVPAFKAGKTNKESVK